MTLSTPPYRLPCAPPNLRYTPHPMAQLPIRPSHKVSVPALDRGQGRLELRPYQTEALGAIKRAYERGVRRQLLVLPVGSGKTLIAARLPELLGDPRLVYLAHRLELLEQTLAVFRGERPDRRAGIEREDKHPSPADTTVVASIQSLCRPARLVRYRPEDWPMMIVDESHRAVADSYLQVFHHFRHLPHDGLPARTDGLLLGITGTAKRTDDVGLAYVFEEVPFTRTLRDMIEERHLVPLRGYLLRGGANLEGVRVRTEDGDRDFDPHALARAVNTPERNRLVVDGTRHKALAEGLPTLVFAADIAHSDALAALFCKAGVRAASIHGNMPSLTRREILERFRRGELEVLVNVQLLLEGIDIPQIAAIVMARPTQSSLLFSQAVGRGTRKYPGKTECIVIDFVDNTHKHAAGLVTLPTLFGLPPRFDLKGATAHEVVRQFEDMAASIDMGLHADVVEKIRSPQDIPRVFYEVDLLKIAGLPPGSAGSPSSPGSGCRTGRSPSPSPELDRPRPCRTGTSCSAPRMGIRADSSRLPRTRSATSKSAGVRRRARLKGSPSTPIWRRRSGPPISRSGSGTAIGSSS